MNLYTPGRAQKAPQFSDIAYKNQLPSVGPIPVAACVVDSYYRSPGQHPYGELSCNFCRFSSLMHVLSLLLLSLDSLGPTIERARLHHNSSD